MIGFWLILCHLVGDYLLQSDWMATEKTKRSLAALAHAITYSLPFVLLTQSPLALLFIFGTHFIIDRWRLARFVCWAKNFIAPKWTFDPNVEEYIFRNGRAFGKTKREVGEVVLSAGIRYRVTQPYAADPGNITGPDPLHTRPFSLWWHQWAECASTGYHKDRPPWLSVWLMIIADNTLHLICNGLALELFA